MKEEKTNNENEFFNLVDPISLDSKNTNLNDDSIIFNIFEQFSGLNFGKNDSLQYINNIELHREYLTEKLGRDIGYGVTILDYFLNINKKINNPKILEMEIFLELLRSSKEDQKTGLLNSKYFIELLSNEINRAKRNIYSISVLFIDLDDFKEFNDVFGHLHGDQYLLYIANHIKDIIRKEDIAARFGGDEFTVLLPQTDKLGANIVSHRLIEKISESPFIITNHKKEKYNSKLSIGYASFPFDSENAEELIQKADIALYQAKKNGKNQILGYGYNPKKTLIDNKREKIRYNCRDRKIIINLHNSDCVYTAFIKNISESGALINIPDIAPAFRGIELKGKLDLKNGSDLNKYQFSGKIIYTKKQDSGLLAAVEFAKKIKNVELIISCM